MRARKQAARFQHQRLRRAFSRTQGTLHVAEKVHLRVFSGEEQPVVVRLGELLANSEDLPLVWRPVTGLDEGLVGPVGEKGASWSMQRQCVVWIETASIHP